MVDKQEPYRDPEHIPYENSIREDINNGFVDNISESLATWLRSKQWGLDVRESLALAVEWFSKMKNETPRGTYPTFDDLKKAFPNGDGGKSIYAVLDSQRWYYYKNGAWQDGGVYQIPAIDAAKMDQIGQYLDNLSRNNLVPNAKFQNGLINNVVPSVTGVQLSKTNMDGTTWATAKSPSGEVNNQGLGVIVPRVNTKGQPVIGTGTYKIGFRLFTPSAEKLKVTLIPRKDNGDWLPSFEVGTVETEAQDMTQVTNSAHIDVTGEEKDFLIMVWNTDGEPVDFSATGFSAIKQDVVAAGSSLESGYAGNINYGNIAKNTFFTDDKYPWQSTNTDIALKNEVLGFKHWLHVSTGGHPDQSVTYAPPTNSSLVEAVLANDLSGSLIFKFTQAGVIDIHVIYLDASGKVLDDIIMNTVKSLDLNRTIKTGFTIPRVNRPDLSRVILTLKDHYSAAMDFYITELTLYPAQLEKPDRLSRNIVPDPDLKTAAAYWQPVDGGGYAIVSKLNRRWIKYACSAAQKKPTSRVEYRYNNEETTNDDFRIYTQTIRADVMVETSGTYVFRGASYDRNNVKVRDYTVRTLPLKANTINHIEVRMPRMLPDEFTFGIGICSDDASDLIYYIANLQVEAEINEQTVSDAEIESRSGLPRIDVTAPRLPKDRDDKVNVTFSYSGNGIKSDSYAVMGIQGDSSAAYDKKNYKFKLYVDSDHTTKTSIKPKPDWLPIKNVTLKANWVDQTHALNIVCAKLFADITATRKNMPDELSTAGMFGEIQGFPVSFFINGIYRGLYTFNTNKDEDLFGFGNVPINAGVLEAQNGFKDNGFGKPTIVITDDIKTNPNADMEVQVGKTTVEFQAATNRLAQFVSQSDDATFHDKFSQYLDLEAVLDFLIFFQVAELSDSYDKNIEYTTYDGNIWLPIPYDLDSTFGLNWDGKTEFDPETDMFATGLTNKDFNNFKINKLLNRTLNAFKPEIKARYQELRSTVLTQDRVINMFSEFMNEVGEFDYAREADRWPGIPSKFFTFQKVRSNIIKRFKVSDFIFSKF